MHFNYQALALAALTVSTVAQPTKHLHVHLHRRDLADVLHRRAPNSVDWSNPSLYAGVNWATVDYSNGAKAAQPAPTPAPAPAPAAAPAAPAAPVKAAAPVQVKEKVANAAPAAAAPATSNESNGGGKRGLAYNPTSPSLDIFDNYGKITWGYNWDSAPAGLPSKYQYVPLLFSTLPVHTGLWEGNIKNIISAPGTHYLMSFNEPDMPLPQADMSVPAAVAAYKQYMAPHGSGNVKLGSPAVSSSETPGAMQGLAWLQSFLQQCDGCQIDFVPIHWYGCYSGCTAENDISAFKSYVGDAIKLANGRPLWITEFQSIVNGEAFIAEVLPWLDSQEQVARYSYFMANGASLTSGNGLSALGQKYATA